MFSKYFILIIIFFIAIIKLKAQDTLIYNNGSQKIVKVDEVNSSQIKFHKYENLSGPSYTVSTSEIKFIKYPNGTQDVFVSEDKKNKPLQEDDFIKPKDHVYGRNNTSKSPDTDSLIFRTTNLVYVNFMDLMFMSPSINYESIQGKGNISIWVPVNIGLNPYGARSNYNYGGFWGVRKNYTVGLGLKYYFNGQKPSSFFIAPLFEYGTVVFNKVIVNTYSSGGYSYQYFGTKKEQAPLYIGSLNFGNLFSFKNGLIILLQGGIGVRGQKTKASYTYNNSGYVYNYDYLIYPVIKLGFSVGYRF